MRRLFSEDVKSHWLRKRLWVALAGRAPSARRLATDSHQRRGAIRILKLSPAIPTAISTGTASAVIRWLAKDAYWLRISSPPTIVAYWILPCLPACSLAREKPTPFDELIRDNVLKLGGLLVESSFDHCTGRRPLARMKKPRDIHFTSLYVLYTQAYTI